MAEERDDASEEAAARKDDREASIENVLGAVREDLGEHTYPTRSEELAATYADEPTELPNETESLESAFDRIDDQFDTSEEAYRALLSEFEGGDYWELRPDAATGGATWSEERIDDDRPPADDDTVGGPVESQERASQRQAAESESDGDE